MLLVTGYLLLVILRAKRSGVEKIWRS